MDSTQLTRPSGRLVTLTLELANTRTNRNGYAYGVRF